MQGQGGALAGPGPPWDVTGAARLQAWDSLLPLLPARAPSPPRRTRIRTHTHRTPWPHRTAPQGPYIMGEAFTLADAAAAPFILRLPMYAKLKRVTLGEGLPKLDAYHEALKQRQ